MRTHAYRNTAESSFSLCEGSLRVPARAVVHIPDTRIEHPDVRHLIRVGVLVPYVKPVQLELPLVAAPEPLLEPPAAPPSLISTRRRRVRVADAKDPDNAG